MAPSHQTKSRLKAAFAIVTNAPASLAIRQLVFRHDALDLVALDAISKAAVGLDGEATDDGVNPRLFELHPALRALRAMKDGFV